jgi:hypothetical protein
MLTTLINNYDDHCEGKRYVNKNDNDKVYTTENSVSGYSLMRFRTSEAA